MRRFTVELTVLTLLAGVVSQAEAVIVDGSLGDWGITVNGSGHLAYDSAAYGGYTYNASNPIGGEKGTGQFEGRNLMFHVEDTNDDDNNYKVGPLYGGQNYDAEALIVAIEGNALQIAVSSGQRWDNAPNVGATHKKYYGPGDIYIRTADGDIFGIEVGGGAGGTTTGPPVISRGDDGTTYDLLSNGYTDSSTDLTSQTAGSVWATVAGDWSGGPGASRTQLDHLALIPGDEVTPTGVEYKYRFDEADDPDGDPVSLGEHAFIELQIPNYQTVFDDDLNGAKIRWSPACGNDRVHLEVEVSKGVIPEPASLVVWALLGLTVGGYGWRRRRRV